MTALMLLVDAGNTRIKWALAPADATAANVSPGGAGRPAWIAQGAVLQEQRDGLYAQWLAALPADAAIRGIWLANVAGEACLKTIAEAASKLSGTAGKGPQLHVAKTLTGQCGLRNGYTDHTQLGVDRWISAIGARALHPQTPCMIVTAGTATTIDWISADGRFDGGLILPGLNLMLQSLGRHTAQLPDLSTAQAPLQTTCASDTEAAIRNGCAVAQCGAIEHAWRQMLSRHGAGPEVPAPGNTPLCLLSGGAREALSPALRIPHALHDNLVLSGLRIIALEAVASC